MKIDSASSTLGALRGNSASQPKKALTAFDVNAREFGPTAAAAIGAAAKATQAVGATVSLSSQGVKQLAGLASDAVDAVSGASDLGSEVASLAAGLKHRVEKAYDAVSDAVSTVAHGVEHAAHVVEAPVVAAVDSVVDLASDLKDGLASAADSTVRYATLGLAALA